MCKFLLLTFWISIFATNLFSQEKGQLGIDFSVHSSQSLGLIYHPFKGFALRPAITFKRTTTKKSEVRTALTPDNSDKELSIGGGLSGLFYLGTNEKLSTYVGVEVSYVKFETEENVPSQVMPVETEVKLYAGNALFGLQYAVSRKFSIRGEIGFGLLLDEKQTSLEGTTQSKTFSISNSGIGFIFYLN